jgi:hypothetical protein
LSFENLVPRPDPTRWQTTPEAPFQSLRSEEARAALACCNLDSSMQDCHDQRGRPAYACSVGDTAIWRRQPLQLQTTLAFMLAKDEGRLFRVKAADFADVRECLLWSCQNNPHVRLLMTNLERFGDLYAKIQTLIPLGRKDTPVRIVRSPRAAAAVAEAMHLQDTIGSEEAVLVVVDPSELPRTWASLDLLSEKIGEGTYRATLQGTGAAAELEPGWGSDMSEAASALRGAAKITLGDLHLDQVAHASASSRHRFLARRK